MKRILALMMVAVLAAAGCKTATTSATCETAVKQAAAKPVSPAPQASAVQPASATLSESGSSSGVIQAVATLPVTDPAPASLVSYTSPISASGACGH